MRALLRPVEIYARSASSEGGSDVAGDRMSRAYEFNGLRPRGAEAAGGV